MAFKLQLAVGRHRLSLNNGAHMIAAYVYAYANLPRAQCRRAHACKVFSQGQCGTTREESKRLAVQFVHFHTRHTGVRLGR